MDNKSTYPENEVTIFTEGPCWFNFACYDNRKPAHYHLHWHDFMELLFVKKGCLQTKLRNTGITINEQELLVIMPGELHSTDYDGKDILEYYIIQIDTNFLRNTVFDSRELSDIYPYFFSSWTPDFFLCNADEVKKTGIQMLIDEMYCEFSKKELGYTLFIRSGLLKIFALFLRRWDLNSRPESETGDISISMRMQPVLDFIKEQYHTKISNKEMAEKMCMSVYYFCRLFKKLTGYSFHNYLQFLRIDGAVNLLLSTNDSIKQIAYQVGFHDVNYFVKVFKREIGMSPDKYRKEHTSNPV